MVFYEIVGALVILALIGLGLVKFTSLLSRPHKGPSNPRNKEKSR